MIDEVFRAEWGRVLAALTGFLGDIDLAEEATQDAFAIAAEKWPIDGAPENPGAWLTTTARRRAIDRLRRERTFATAKAPLLAVPEVEEVEMVGTTIPDERLELIFLCCHPALAVEAQVALTLRTLGGLSTQEIAQAFLVPPGTMKRRLTRAKTKIKVAGIPFRMPPDHVLPERVGVVLKVIYLIFNVGYGGRDDLADEAIRLGRLLAALMPDEPEALGLLALMLCQHARNAARRIDGDIVLLDRQDRDHWDSELIAESRALLDRTIAWARGPYVLQAAIAVLHTAPEIDWAQIAALYLELARLTDSPVIELNRAVAVAQAGSPQAALRITDGLDLDSYPYLHSTRAELLRRLDRTDEALVAYRRALELLTTEPERRLMRRHITELEQQ